MNRLAAVVGLAVLFIVGTSVGVRASDLGGETFTWDGSGSPVNGTFFCAPAGTGTMTYGVSRGGIATGPFAGSFNEDGLIAFSGGLVTGWSANFTVRTAGVVVLRGTKSLTAGGAGPATCSPARPGCRFISGGASATLTYTTTFPTSDTGQSSATLNGVFNPCTDDVTGSSLDETFGPTGLPAPNTPPGTDVVVSPVDTVTNSSPVTVTFSSVTAAGNTTLTTSSTGPLPPAGFMLGPPPVYYNLATTATFVPPIEICISPFTGAQALYHYEGVPLAWVNVTDVARSTSTQICGTVTSLSPFALFAAVATTPIAITCPAPITAEATSSAGAAVTPGIATVSGGVGAVTVTSPAAGVYPLGDTVVTYTATDSASHSASCTTDIKVVDTTPPTITCPAPITVFASANGSAIVTFAATATDAVGIVGIVYSIPSGSSFLIGTTTVTAKAQDLSGNLATCTFTVTVLKASPTLTTQATATATAGGTISDTATLALGAAPTGSITFKLFGPADPTCAGALAATSTVPVSSGNGTYTSSPFTAIAAGTYSWVASYGGDTSNNPVATPCGAAGEISTVAVPPSTAGCAIDGAGKIVAANGDKARFVVDFGSKSGSDEELPGNVQTYRDLGPTTAFNFMSTQNLAATCNDKKSGSIYGTGLVNGTTPVSFIIDITTGSAEEDSSGNNDRESNHTPATYRLRLSNGYDSGVRNLKSGNISVHMESDEEDGQQGDRGGPH